MSQASLLWLPRPMILALLTQAGCSGDRGVARALCAAGETLAADGCVPDSCGEPPWAGETVAAWVAAEAAEGGDGSEEAPFRAIREGLDTVAGAGGGVVAVLPGTYEERLVLGEEHDGVRVLGRCAALAQMDVVEDEAGVEATLPAEGTGGSVSGLEVVGGTPGVLLNSGALALSDLVVEDSVGAGIQVGDWGRDSDAALSLERVEVRGTTALVGSQAYTTQGAGILVMSSTTLDAHEVLVKDSASSGLWANTARADLRDVTIEGAVGIGLAASWVAEINVEDAVITGVVDDGVLFQGIGLFAESSSHIRAERLAISDTEGYGVQFNGTAGEVLALFEPLDLARTRGYGLIAYYSDVEIRGCDLEELQPTTSGPDGFGPWGVGVWTARATLSECMLAVDGGQLFATEGSTLVMTDSEIDGSNGTDSFNSCLQVSESEATLTEVDLHDCQREGIWAEQSALSLSGVTIRSSGGVLEGDAPLIGAPLYLWSSVLDADGLQVLDSRGVALLVDRGSEATLTDVLIEGVRSVDEFASAIGVELVHGTSLSASALEVREVEGVGLFQSYSTTSCSGCVFEALEFAGMVSIGDSVLKLEGVKVEGVSPDESQGGGVGVAVARGELENTSLPIPMLTLRDSEVRSVELASVYLDGKGSYEIRDSVLEAGAGDGVVVPASNAVFVTGGVGVWNESAVYNGLLLEGVDLVGGEGGAVFLDGSSATLRDLTFTDVGKTLVQDRCDGVATPEGIEELEDPELCPTYDYPLGLLDWYLYTLSMEVEG